MWNIIQIVLFSILIIVSFHYLWNYVKDTYSVKKTKDVYNIQTEKYKAILADLIDNQESVNANNDIDYLSMEKDLEQFIQMGENRMGENRMGENRMGENRMGENQMGGDPTYHLPL